MRTKLFFAFLLVIFIALISNLIFERLIMMDFDEYIKGTQDDHFYWLRASIEGSYQGGRWNMSLLSDAIHWGMMLGFDLRIEEKDGRELINSHVVMDSLPPAMKQRMESMIPIHSAAEGFRRYPLHIGDKEIGTLFVRQFSSGDSTTIKEAIFRGRGKNFLTISFLIAGTGAIAMAVFLSRYLSRPLKRLKSAAEKVATGDFSIRLEPATRDEIGKVTESFNYMAGVLQKEEMLRKRLTSNIAHELRTPLAVMKAQVEAMIDGVVKDKSEGLGNIRGEIERLTELVEGIEDITKAEASFFSKGEYRVINLKELLKGIEYALTPVFNEKGLSFSMIDRGDVGVTTDAEKLERIIRNLISNSLKFTEKGGVWIDYGRGDKEFFVEVRDSGSGIPEDEIPKIFMRFYRGMDASKSGVGIGLAIVRELVDVMRGRIDVNSRVGEGTTFRIWLPLK